MRRVFTEAEQRRAVQRYDRANVSIAQSARQQDLNPSVLRRWIELYGTLPNTGGRRPNPRNQGGRSRGAYTPEERRLAVERYTAAQIPQGIFARLFGVSVRSLATWVRRYRADGPKALETATRGPKAGAARSKRRLPQVLRDLIVATSNNYPSFGLRKLRQYLSRFHAVRVSQGGIRATLEHAGVPRVPLPPSKTSRNPPALRRFERSKPNELWQSDITSFKVPRTGREFFLTVFLDDRSRFVVAHAIAHRQTSEFVMNCLLAGVAGFGKPKEVLTDQGRQYSSWRGKSAFRKLLDREGIGHVVSRAHHPETLGKCERLWETIGSELFSRVSPTSFEDAEERLCNWFDHYNFQRPHQGIDGAVPADRFFGVESEVRRVLEEKIEHNALRLALGVAPKQPVYLVGQIGDQKIALHGEGGRLVMHGQDGRVSELSMEDVGSAGGKTKTKEQSHDNSNTSNGNDGNERSGSGDSGPANADTGGAQADPVQPTGSGLPGTGALELGDRGRAADGPPDLRGDPRDVAWEGGSTGGCAQARDDSSAADAAVPAGGLGHDGGAPAPAAVPSPEGGA